MIGAMADNRADSELVEGCLAGDGQAWAQLVGRYQRLVYSVALRHGLSPEDADDVFQAVFTILLGKLETCRDRRRLGAWLVTITRREAWRVARGRNSSLGNGSDELLEARAAAEPLPEAIFEQLEEQDLIRQALEQLGEPCRRLLEHLFYRQQPLSYAEIAQQLAMPEGSIGPTRARCLAKLRDILASLGLLD